MKLSELISEIEELGFLDEYVVKKTKSGIEVMRSTNEIRGAMRDIDLRLLTLKNNDFHISITLGKTLRDTIYKARDFLVKKGFVDDLGNKEIVKFSELWDLFLDLTDNNKKSVSKTIGIAEFGIAKENKGYKIWNQGEEYLLETHDLSGFISIREALKNHRVNLEVIGFYYDLNSIEAESGVIKRRNERVQLDFFEKNRDVIKRAIEEDSQRGGIQLPKGNVVHHPDHYNQGTIECIDAMEAMLTPEEFRGFLRGSIFKYQWRVMDKNGVEDLEKAQWYLDKLIEKLRELESKK